MSKNLKNHATCVARPQYKAVSVPEGMIVIVGAFTVLRVAGVPQGAAIAGLTAAVSLGVRAALRLVSAIRAALPHA